MTSYQSSPWHLSIKMPNHAINAGGLGQRAYGASPNPAGYGERSNANP